MTRYSGLQGVFRAAVLAAGLLAGVGAAHPAELPVCWVDSGPTHNWTDADNWNPPLAGGPRNVGTLEFLISIGCPGDPNNCPEQTFNPVYFDYVTGPIEITDFFLCNDSKLVLNPSTDLSVLRTTEIDGIIDGQGGIFTAPDDPNFGSAIFSGNRTRLWVSDGSIVTIWAPTYSSTNLYTSGNSTWSLMTASDPNTLLDLSVLTEINAGFNDGDTSYHETIHKITCSDGATIALPAVETITGPAQWDDQLEIELSGATSEIDLDGVETITTTSRGQVHLETYDGATLELPSASTFHHTRFIAETGSSLIANSPAATYSSTNLYTSGSSTWTLMTASDPNTLLDLSALTEINAGFNDGDTSYHETIHKITCSDGATIALPAVETITGPAQRDDQLEIELSGATSEIDLDGVETITTSSRGQVHLETRNGATLELPSASTFHHTRFIAETGSSLIANSPAATYSSTNLYTSGSSTWTLMTASDPNTLLDLPALTEINAGFNDGDTTYNTTVHKITCSNGATIGLGSLEKITGPALHDDSLQFTVSGADSRVDMPALGTVTNAGSGKITMSVSNGGITRMGSVVADSVPLACNVGTDAVLRLASLQACSPVGISLTASTARLEVDDFLRLGDDITIAAPTGGTLSLGGDLSYTHEDAADVALALTHVECVGESQLLEVGGPDYDVWVDFIPDNGQGGRGFGFKQLTVGGSGQASTVELVDRHDNMMAGVADALYLFGVQDPNNPSADTEGLQILDGSTLVIGDLNAYVLLDLDASGNLDGVLEYINLRDLFAPGETIIPFDHNGNDGYISLTPTYYQADLVEDGQVNLQDLQMLLAYYGTTCFAEPYQGDLNGDGDVDLGDLQTLLALYGSYCP